MALRIISGLLMPKSGYRDNGSATIRLKDNDVIAGDAYAVEKCEYGPKSHYDSEPCKIVSIRYFKGQPDTINLTDIFQGGFNEVVISWNCSSGGEIIEISYLFAGEE